VPDKFYNQIVANQIIGTNIQNDALIQIHHYLASNQAKNTIDKDMHIFAKDISGLTFETSFSHVLPGSIVLDNAGDTKLVSLVTQWYDPKIQTSHTGKDIWFGYKQCGLPLVLDHNTPNNSLAFLWAISPATSKSVNLMRPLFPRKQRHSDHGQSNAKSI
jgi:hypothetical protein